ncbi:MAG: DUF4282 domain-containing protein [Chloroflexaceae bacterium]|nr:DUF4282 domain-containing protein [Chloroflexaceae bacterium]
MQGMVDFLTFRRMITPIIIQVLFWIALVLVVVFGFIAIIIGFAQGEVLSGLLSGLASIILGPIVVRVYAEILILFFSMNDTLNDIKNLLSDSRDRV